MVRPSLISRNKLTRSNLIGAATFSLALAGMAYAGGQATPSTQPAPAAALPTPGFAPKSGTLEGRAMEAMGNKDYATALPLLRRLADLMKDDARKLAAVNAQIKEAEGGVAAGVQPGVTNESRKPIPAPKDGEVPEFLNIKDLGNFEYDGEKGGGIPADVKALSDKPIRIRGFMIPLDQSENISQFALVPSLFACCFGQPPQIQHTIIVKTPKGKTISYYPDELLIEGKLKVDEKKEDGFVVSVFEMSATSVKPAPAVTAPAAETPAAKEAPDSSQDRPT
jgi:hypothetical protein